LMNENYEHPAMPQGVEQGILKGMYLLRESKAKHKSRVQLLGSGTILREVLAAADLLEADWGIAADVWSATSLTEMRRDGLAADRWNMLHPEAKPRVPYVTDILQRRPAGPVLADQGEGKAKSVADAMKKYGIDAEKPDPTTV